MQCPACEAYAPAESIFCNKCGTRFEVKKEIPAVPEVMTVIEACEKFFNGHVSKTLLYEEIRRGHVPCIRMGKNHILLDRNELITWWQEQTEKSKQTKFTGLRRIN